ncbi:ABC transporter permease [Butyrivibrio sp. JL13D10]|uniref:ABC transporter permease n=1 Tax=Butyrivibrio sp. JL13D10 TaxID=3236815 RepID=UPI0038B58165
MNIRKFVKNNAIWLVFVAMVIIFTIASKGVFLRPTNLVAVGRQVAVYGIAAVGMTFVILIAGIDLSTGSIITLVNIICAYFMVNAGMNMWVAVSLSVAIATLVGLLNGFMVSKIGIPALIATFASQTIFEGAAYLISGGIPISGFTKDFDLFGKSAIGIVPVSVIIMIICLAVGSFILNKSYFGRYFYAIGGNEDAAELSGIRVNRVKYLIYSLSGFFAGIAGIVMLSRTGSAQGTAGKGYEFDVITCVVLGGVSVNGGVGRISGVIAGVLIIGSLTNGMILMDVSTYMQMVVKGIVLAIAVGVDCISKKRQAA